MFTHWFYRTAGFVTFGRAGCKKIKNYQEPARLPKEKIVVEMLVFPKNVLGRGGRAANQNAQISGLPNYG